MDTNSLAKKLKVIIDTDMDFDDYLAILFLLKNPNIDVLGVMVTGVGAVHLKPGVANMKYVLKIFDDASIRNIPVLKGAIAPLSYSNMFPYDIRLGADKRYDALFTNYLGEEFGKATHETEDVVDWFKQTLSETDEPITILSIGGGTNLATLYTHLPELMTKKIEKIVMMGGNILEKYITDGMDFEGAAGNIKDAFDGKPMYDNDVAEWNIFIDPKGVDIVFKSQIPIVLVSLNASQHVKLDQDFVNKLDTEKSRAAKFAYEVLEYPLNKAGIGKFLYFWDPLAACAVANPSIVKTVELPLEVYLKLDEENDRSGELVVDSELGSNISVAVYADKKEVYDFYLETINIPD